MVRSNGQQLILGCGGGLSTIVVNPIGYQVPLRVDGSSSSAVESLMVVVKLLLYWMDY